MFSITRPKFGLRRFRHTKSHHHNNLLSSHLIIPLYLFEKNIVDVFMNPAQLQQLESLTEKAFTSPSQQERNHAEEALKVFTSPEYLPQCRFILDNSHSDYATLFAGSSMMKVLTNNWNSFTVTDRIDIHIF